MRKHTIALFGAAEKGLYKTPYHLKKLPELMDYLGNPPPDTEGLFFAIQALLYNREVIFFRVEEEGMNKDDYFEGFQYLKNKIKIVHALCLPGVGNQEILQETLLIPNLHKSPIITTQKDLYDYLTS